MRMIGAPLVYVGPTLSAAAVAELYPGAIVRPPIRRGDLYRDRMLRGAVFLILDGVFHQDEAISPREILDVLADGAFVAGASSMGAMRAAECWPAGMRGVGSIYRMFRSGRLESDDEVAVTFAQTPAGPVSSVPLVNVRFAARQVRRLGRVDAGEAVRLVAAAQAMFYADRHWPVIVQAAGLQDRAGLPAELVAHDLKAMDARRALTRLARWVREDPTLLQRPRATLRAFTPSDESRERGHDARAIPRVVTPRIAMERDPDAHATTRALGPSETTREPHPDAHATTLPFGPSETAREGSRNAHPTTRMVHPAEAPIETGRGVPATTRIVGAADESRQGRPDLRPIDDESALRLELARWLFASGRYLDHAAALLAAIDAAPRASGAGSRPRENRGVIGRRQPRRLEKAGVRSGEDTSQRRAPQPERMPRPEPEAVRRELASAALEVADAALADLGFVPSPQTRAAYVAVVTHHARARSLFAQFAVDETAYADVVWLVLTITDARDAELFHLHALRAAVARASEQGLEPTPIDRHAAELRIATTHGFPAWSAFMESLAAAPEARELAIAHCREAAMARAGVRVESELMG